MAYSVGDIVAGDGVISKYLSASEDFSAYGTGETVVGTLLFEQPVSLRGIGLSANESTSFANGPNSLAYVESLSAPDTSIWAPFARMQVPSGENTGGFNGFTWAEIGFMQTLGLMTLLPFSDADGTDAPAVSWGVRFRVFISGSDASLAGVLDNLWIHGIKY